ncbi:hypothetical protein [Halobaculum marinum]|uniref:Uncharacterized protein n=1 Tax=Halobaculum marinum TaxID=3031996 RepID=A0ABD5WYZ3_9EURY|nr:hypothetical protein [Halobaculum sp. DT55]
MTRRSADGTRLLSPERAALSLIQGGALAAFNVSGGNASTIAGWIAFYVLASYAVFTAFAAARSRLVG